MTTKEKIDQALGISCGKSMDEMLDELNIDSQQIHKTLDGFDQTLSTAVSQIDKKALELQHGIGDGVLVISDINISLKEIEDMIKNAKCVFQHIADNITGSDLIDSELVMSYSKLLESIHLNIAEFISIYKQKSKFVEKIKLMIFQQQQRIELAELKHKQNLELLAAKSKEMEPVNVKDGEYEFNTDNIIKSMSRSGAFAFDQKPIDISFDDQERDDENEDEDEDEDDTQTKKKKH